MMLHSWRARIGLALLVLPVFAGSGAAQGPAAEAKALRKRIGSDRGLVVLLGAKEGALAVELAKSGEFLVYLQSPQETDVAAIRKSAETAGLLGRRIFVEHGAAGKLHLADNLADAVIAGDKAGMPEAELLRVLRPEGKVLLPGKELTKPFPKETDDWGHPYHGPDNNPQSKDLVARGPHLTHYLAEPWYAAMPQMSVISGGRIFKACGNRSSAQPQWPMLNTLLAINAFNGTPLWKRELTPGFMMHRNTLIATPKTLFLGDDVSCKLIDAATGKVEAEIVVPADISDGPVWKWMAVDNGILYALVGEKEPLETTIRTGGFRGAGWPWWGLKDYPFGFGRTVLAIDPATRKILWHHRAMDRLDSRAMCMTAGKIFIYAHPKYLACLDAKTGKVLWTGSDPEMLKAIGEHKPAQNPWEGFSSTSYVKCSDKVLFFAGPTRSNLVGVSATDGKLLWQHPEGNYQLVLRDDALYALGRGRAMVGQGSMKLDPLKGEILARFASRDRCTRATGCIDSIFTRGGNGGSTAVFDMTGTDPQVRVLSPMRPACQDGVLVAHGLLFWGPWMCRCDNTQIGLISVEPAGALDVAAKATDAERLQTIANVAQVAPLAVSEGDWPTYRRDNAGTCRTAVAVPLAVQSQWEYKPLVAGAATAPVTAGNLVFFSSADGAVRALDAASGKQQWSAYTGGAVKYPPSVWRSRLYVGSADGWIYCFEAATGKTLWRFRAAPAERTVPVFGALISTWPVASGVLVEDGIAYAAAGTFNYNGTHVYALDAASGKIRWHNNTSGTPNAQDGPRGPGVQGHLLLNKQQLCLAGGNTSAVAVYDIANGNYSPGAGGSGGKDLFLSNGQVRATGFPLYWRPDDSHFITLVELPADKGTLQVNPTQVALLEGKDAAGKPKAIWTAQPFLENAAVAIAKNAILVAGVDRGEQKSTAGVCALNPTDGKVIWKQTLPANPVSFGLAIDRNGRILISLVDGQVVCLGAAK